MNAGCLRFPTQTESADEVAETTPAMRQEIRNVSAVMSQFHVFCADIVFGSSMQTRVCSPCGTVA